MKKSVIFRGSISFDKHPKNFFADSVKKLREWFNGEVILSTWKGQEKFLTGQENVDKVILSDDPLSGPVQQLNRQVKSYEAGLDNVTGDLVLVTRTDIIHHTDVFSFYNEKTEFDSRFKLFDNRLLIGNIMSIRPDSNERVNTYRLSDWFQMGNRADIENWGRISHILSKNQRYTTECTEKIWLVSVLIKNGVQNITSDNTTEIDKYYWDVILNNFLIKNTRSTLNSHNMNWSFLSEFADCYITENEYERRYVENYAHL